MKPRIKIHCKCEEYDEEVQGQCSCGHDKLSHPKNGACVEYWRK